jgi:hypothetical protein
MVDGAEREIAREKIGIRAPANRTEPQTDTWTFRRNRTDAADALMGATRHGLSSWFGRWNQGFRQRLSGAQRWRSNGRSERG